ncbi:MAG: cell division protein ZapC [Verrucomicrobia bacterium]|nr:cell division protein ZapC [Verrucomicrobiota bacterium]MBM3871897.1 cell division protein ZapC [Verrucomicrobiota bacterium]
MSLPLFIEVQSTLLNLAFIESSYVEDTTLYVAVRDEVHEFEYEDEERALRGLVALRELLASRSLLIGSVK